MGEQQTSKDLSTPICGTPVPETLHRECQCGLAQDVGFLLICDSFADDDTGDCLTCGHAKACHEAKGLEEWRSIFDKGSDPAMSELTSKEQVALAESLDHPPCEHLTLTKCDNDGEGAFYWICTEPGCDFSTPELSADHGSWSIPTRSAHEPAHECQYCDSMRAEHERLRQALATASAPPPGREQQFRALLERAQPLLIAAGLYTSSAVEAKTQLLTDIASALTKCAAPRCKHCKDTGRIESGNGYDAEVCYDCDAYQRETDILLGRQPPKEIGP